MMAELKAKEIMQDHAVVVSPNTPLVEVVETLINKKLSGVAVVDNNNKVVGLVSEYDCHKAMLMSSYYCDNPVYVSDIMSTNFVALDPEDGIANMAIKLLEEPSNVYLVIKNEKLMGTLTRHHILKALNNNLSLCSKISKKVA